MPPKKTKKFVPLPLDTPYLAPPSSATHSGISGSNTTTSTSSVPVTSTFFPSINSGIQKIINNFNKDRYRLTQGPDKKWVVKPQLLQKASPKLALVGTVKLHGVHIDLVFDHSNAETFRIQSRNVAMLDVSNDIFDVVATLRKPAIEAAIVEIRDRFLASYAKLNTGTLIDQNKPLIIAGEWVGPGIFNTVALEEFPARAFVVLNFFVNGGWVPSMSPYADLHAQEQGILNISWGGLFPVDLLVDKPDACFAEVERLTLAVEKECPFALATGRRVGRDIKGVGEGIVWRLSSPSSVKESSERYWAKTKGPLHSEVDAIRLPAMFDADARAAAKAFAEYAVTDTRLEKKWVDMMESFQGMLNASHTGKFMELLGKDVEKEESVEIDRLKINVIEARKAIGVIGKPWFHAKLKAMG